MDKEYSPHVYGYFNGFLGNFGSVKHRTPNETIARCPDPEGRHNNGDSNPSLSIGLHQNGRGPAILVNCLSQGCGKEAILSAVGLSLKDLYPTGKNGAGSKQEKKRAELPGCTLEEYAAHKNLPLEFLTSEEVGLVQEEYWCPDSKKNVPALCIPYADETGEEIEGAVTWRTGLKKTDPDTRVRRLSKKRGGELALYGLHRIEEAHKAGYVLLVEGESDCHTAWYHGLPAIGVPGAQNWRDEWAIHLDGLGQILVCVEDEAGEELYKTVRRCEALAGRVGRIDFDGAL